MLWTKNDPHRYFCHTTHLVYHCVTHFCVFAFNGFFSSGPLEELLVRNIAKCYFSLKNMFVCMFQTLSVSFIPSFLLHVMQRDQQVANNPLNEAHQFQRNRLLL